MKATVDGIELEGTAEEIWDYIRQSNYKGVSLQPAHPMPAWDGPWWGIFPPSDASRQQEYLREYNRTTPYPHDIIVRNL